MRITAAVVRAPGQPFVIEDLDLDEPRAHTIEGDAIPQILIPQIVEP